MKNKKPYTFETELNAVGDTVVFIKKGRKKVWLFNIDYRGYIDLTIGDQTKELTSIGLQVDKYGQIDIHGNDSHSDIMTKLKYIEESLNEL
jgi:hypothetical protein